MRGRGRSCGRARASGHNRGGAGRDMGVTLSMPTTIAGLVIRLIPVSSRSDAEALARAAAIDGREGLLFLISVAAMHRWVLQAGLGWLFGVGTVTLDIRARSSIKCCLLVTISSGALTHSSYDLSRKPAAIRFTTLLVRSWEAAVGSEARRSRSTLILVLVQRDFIEVRSTSPPTFCVSHRIETGVLAPESRGIP